MRSRNPNKFSTVKTFSSFLMTFSQFIYGGSSFSLLISQKNRIIYDFCVEIWWDIIQLKRDVSGGMRWKNCHAKHFYDNKMRALNKTKNNYKTSMSCTLNCIPTCCCGYSSVENPHTQKKVNEFFSIFYDKSTRFVALCVIVNFIFFYWIEFTHTPLWWCKAKCALSLTRCRYAIKKL